MATLTTLPNEILLEIIKHLKAPWVKSRCNLNLANLSYVNAHLCTLVVAFFHNEDSSNWDLDSSAAKLTLFEDAEAQQLVNRYLHCERYKDLPDIAIKWEIYLRDGFKRDAYVRNKVVALVRKEIKRIERRNRPRRRVGTRELKSLNGT